MLEETGVALGLPADVSHRLAVETAYGSGCMAREATESAATLRQQVTSKGGTTAAALQVLEDQNVRAIFAAAVTAASSVTAAGSSMQTPTRALPASAASRTSFE